MAKGKGGEGGYAGDDNVKKGPGSKGGSDSGRGKGPSVTAADGGSSGHSSGEKPSTATEKSTNVEYAEGGSGGENKMFGEQQAGSRVGGDKSPSTGKPDDKGPGEKFAEGGKTKMFTFAGALPATAGISAPRES